MATFHSDFFTGVAALALESHTPDVGTTWSKKVGSTSAVLSGAGKLNSATGETFTTYMADTAPGTTDYFAQIDETSSGSFYPFTHMTSDGASGYYGKYGGGRYQLYKRVAGTDTFAGQGPVEGAETSLRLATRSNGSGGNIHEVYAGTAGSPLTLRVTITELSSDNWGGTAPIVAAGNAGLIAFNSSTRVGDNFIAGTGTAPGLLASTVALTAPGPNATNVRLTAAAASGGTGPYTYLWYRDTVPGFTPSGSNDLPGETALTLVNAPPDGAVYYYRIRATDSVAATADSATFGCSLWFAPLLIGFAGDSNYSAPPADGTENPPTLIGRHMQKLAGARDVTISNQAVSATQTAHWQPGQATYDTAAGAFTTALAAAPSGALKDLFFMLGTNDAGSTSQATFESRMTTTVEAFLALGWGRVLLCYQPPIQYPADQTRNQALLLYQASLATIAAGDPTHIKVVGQDVYKFLFPHPEQANADGIHLLKLGGASLAQVQARDYAEILVPSSGVSGGSFVFAA